jgi:cell division protein FtsI/penicillin-binding protein 2
MFDTSAGYIAFGPRRIHDMHRYQALSFMDVIVKSSNVGAIKIGQALGSDAVSRYVLPLRLRRDAGPRHPVPARRPRRQAPAAVQAERARLVSMGYQIGVTPLQMVAAVGSIANGGELIAPHVVRATIVDGVRTEVPRQVVRRTIPTRSPTT